MPGRPTMAGFVTVALLLGAPWARADIEPSADWLEGFARALGGERISYHSTRIDCTEALITRATTGAMSIAWETAPVPADWRGRGATFFWLAGMDLADEGRRFDVLVDGRKRFELHTGRLEAWAVEGPDGGRLEFDVVKHDEHADGFGYARLYAPPAWLTPGEPLTLEVVGEAAGSRLWFMTFTCPDALEYFREKQRQEGSLDLYVQLGPGEAKVAVGRAHPWPGRALGVRSDGRPPAKNLVLTLDDEDLADIPLDADAVDQRHVSGNRIVRVQSAGTDGDQRRFRITVAYEPELARRLRSMGDREICLISSSHQDIAWMDSPRQCIADRDERLITPLLERLDRDPAFAYDMENVLCLREYLERHPQRRDDIERYVREGRLTWGASYNAPYEEMYGGEALVRQFYQGRMWLQEALPGCDTVTYWNVDVPGRTLQMPQILAKAGVRHMIISRHAPGLFRWLAPDGSGVNVYSAGHYADAFRHLDRDFIEAAAYIAETAAAWPQTAPLVPILSAWDAASPDVHAGLLDGWRSLGPQVPSISYTTATAFMDRAAKSSADWPTIRGERPNVWAYIHGPSHHRAVTAAREGQIALTQAETFSTVEALAAGSFAAYPQQELTTAWAAAIYPDHGWGGRHGDVTDALFREKLEFARDEAKRIRDQALGRIAARIVPRQDRGRPVAVFNSLSWPRTGPVMCELADGENAVTVTVTDADGRTVPSQVVKATAFGGSPAPRRVIFAAREVPPLGYRTYYLQTAPQPAITWTDLDPTAPVETPFYRIDLAPGGLAQVHDTTLDVDLLRTEHLLGGEIFTLGSVGNGAGEFADVQQPTMDGFDRMRDHASAWKLVETGPVRDVLRAVAKLEHVTAVITLEVYRTIKRIDVRAALKGWDGTPYREFRLAFPAGLGSGQVAYEVPFGVVEVGRDELSGAAGERYVTPCAAVRPRGIGRWIGVANERWGLTLASSVAVVDFRDATRPDRDEVVLQPVLLASRRSCHGQGPLYAQEGDHHFHFALTSHEPGWINASRFGLAVHEPLLAVPVEPRPSGRLPESGRFLSSDAPHVIVSTLKKAQRDDSAILRLYNLSGRSTDAQVRLFCPIRRAERTDLLEAPSAPLPVSGKTIAVEMGGWAIETVRFR